MCDDLRLLARYLFLTVAAAVSTPLWCAGVQTLETVEVKADATGLIGNADTSSQGAYTRDQIEARPTYRSGELLEGAPGVIVTQHSGEGKANQYFLRGMSLDHGTDLAISVDGMPVNQRTHGHGQGYSDLNFLIQDFQFLVVDERFVDQAHDHRVVEKFIHRHASGIFVELIGTFHTCRSIESFGRWLGWIWTLKLWDSTAGKNQEQTCNDRC